MPPKSIGRSTGSVRFRTAIETLEPRRMMSTTYLVSTDTAFAALSSKKFVAGDQILLKGGTTFHGRLYLDSGDTGSATSPILIGSYNPATNARISDTAAASARATIAAGNGDGIFAWDTGGLNIRGLNIVGSGASVNKGAGINLYDDISSTDKRSGITINHVEVSGFGQNGIQFGGGNGKAGYSNVNITYANSHDNREGGIHSYGVFSSTSTAYANANVYIGHCNTYNNYGVAGVTKPLGNGIFLADVNSAKVEYCNSYNNGKNNTSGTGPEGIWAWDSNAVTIQYNEVHHNHSNGADGGGIDLDGGVTNSIVQYNYVHDNVGFGIGLWQYNGQRPWANNTVYNNVTSNNGLNGGSSGVEVFLWNNGPKMTNVKIYTNTLAARTSKTAFLSMVQSNVTATIWNNKIQVGGTVNTSLVGLIA